MGLQFLSDFTAKEGNDLEMIQKRALSIIIGPKLKSYSSALKILNQEKLSTGRLIYRTLSKLDEFSLNFLSILQIFL